MPQIYLSDETGKLVHATNKNYNRLLDQGRKAVVIQTIKRDDLEDQLKKLETAWLDEESQGKVSVKDVFQDVFDLVKNL